MTKRRTASYRSVFEEIKTLFPDFKPKVAITDFESGLRKALKQSFGLTNDQCLGCHFHYSQARIYKFQNCFYTYLKSKILVSSCT